MFSSLLLVSSRGYVTDLLLDAASLQLREYEVHDARYVERYPLATAHDHLSDCHADAMRKPEAVDILRFVCEHGGTPPLSFFLSFLSFCAFFGTYSSFISGKSESLLSHSSRCIGPVPERRCSPFAASVAHLHRSHAASQLQGHR